MSPESTGPSGSTPGYDGTLDLRPFLQAIYLRRSRIALGFLVGLGLGAAGWGLLGRQYEAVVTLTINQPRVETAIAVNPANYRAMLENYSIAATAIKNASLDQGARAMTPRDFIRKVLSIEEIRGTNLLRIHVRLRDPETAARVANDVAKLAVDLNRRVNQEEGTSLRDQLQAQRTEAEERLRQAEQTLVAFEERSHLDVLKADVDGLLKQRATLPEVEGELSAERAGEAVSSTEQKARPPLLTLKRSIDSDTAMTEMAREHASGQALLGLGIRAEESNKVYQTIDEAVAKARSRIAQLEKERDYILSASKTMTDGGRLADYYNLQIEKARLEANVTLARKVYEDVALRYEQARVVVTSGSAQLQVVDAAVPSDVPVSWPIWVWLIFGAIVGIAVPIMGIAGAVIIRMVRASMIDVSPV